MNDTFRTLCARLADHLQPHVTKADNEVPAWGYYSQAQQLIDHTRWQLARSIDDDLLTELDGNTNSHRASR